ncbi:hypothetical protein [Streptococcus gordonii]|uniref:DUF202 domain-containing protein n=1 Tax=Streptococcus gordonii TaxID=1302 RepID=A0AAW3H478_STRGN|nr:hypothetical protein [Streptococcus gordonii]KJQ56480.1 hypothetical protein TZ86_01816 [Streptococcus gordonii]
MKKSVVEKTSDHILKLNQEMDRQRESQKEFLQQQAEKRKVWLEKITQDENLIRYSKWGVKAGYAVLAGGLLTSVFSPWRGLGIMAVGGVSLLSNFYHIKRLEEKKKKEN